MAESDPADRTARIEASAGADTAGASVVNVGLLVAHSPAESGERLAAFAAAVAAAVAEELATATEAHWRFYAAAAHALADNRPRRPSEFLDEAALRMVEGPYDVVVVVTDVPLLSRRKRRVSGLASPIGQLVVVSTHKLLLTPRDESTRALDSPSVRRNGAALLLHELGHLMGVRHTTAGAMAPFEFDPARSSLPSFEPPVASAISRSARRLPDTAATPRSLPARIAFHLRSAVTNAGQIGRTISQSRAPKPGTSGCT
jgi:predicted Zn-dependent protease